jgi:hypothetical protein
MRLTTISLHQDLQINTVIPGLVAPRIHALLRQKAHPSTDPGIHFITAKRKWTPGQARGDSLTRDDCLTRGDCLARGEYWN